jgi:hypothetical protein
MGRPPIGKVAMTSTERVHRHRERKFGNKPPVTKSPAAVAKLEARIRELEAKLVGRAKVSPQWTASLYDLLSAYAELIAEKSAPGARARLRPSFRTPTRRSTALSSYSRPVSKRYENLRPRTASLRPSLRASARSPAS